jgi:hypothetical protein
VEDVRPLGEALALRDSDSQTAQRTWRFYGELAATRESSLNDVIMHCLCWRDVVAEVLRQSATELHISSDVLSRAVQMLQVATDYGFLRTSKAFDSERQRADEDLAFTSTHDGLTGLPNRILILDRVERMLARTRRHGAPAAALLIGVDNFKSVNERSVAPPATSFCASSPRGLTRSCAIPTRSGVSVATSSS